MRALVRGSSLVAVLLLLFAALPAAAADDTQSARAHFARGTKLYDLGRYLDAAKEYEATYELKDDPALLFNIGQAYRLGKNYPDAIRAYKSFLRRVPASDQRASIEGYIADMQAAIEREQAKPPPPAPPPSGTTTAPTPAPVATTPSAQNDRGAATPVYKKWWLWTIVGGVVVAGVVVGVTVGVLASQDSFHPSLGKLGPGALTVSF
jgi:tetratricopeptide (TPR) repeat protein